jgi:hypothetical protein
VREHVHGDRADPDDGARRVQADESSVDLASGGRVTASLLQTVCDDRAAPDRFCRAFFVTGAATVLVASDQGESSSRSWPWAAIYFAAARGVLALLALAGVRVPVPRSNDPNDRSLAILYRRSDDYSHAKPSPTLTCLVRRNDRLPVACSRVLEGLRSRLPIELRSIAAGYRRQAVAASFTGEIDALTRVSPVTAYSALVRSSAAARLLNIGAPTSRRWASEARSGVGFD